MKIKMKTLAASSDGVMQPDREYEVSENTVKALVDGGYAELVAGEEVSQVVEAVEEPVKEEAKKGKK